MIGVICDDSKALMLDEELANPPFTTLKMGLFTNVYTPTHLTHLADLVEVVVAGYARQTVSGWSAATLSADFHAVSQANPVTFVNTDVVDSPPVQGWFYLDTTTNKLVSAANFDAPFILLATVGTITIVPFFRKTGE